jgi:hypothetical protein
MISTTRFSTRLRWLVFAWCSGAALSSCRTSDSPSPASPMLSADAGSKKRPVDDTTTGHPIGPISRSADEGGAPNGTGGWSGSGGAGGAGGSGGVVPADQARR